MTALEMFRIVAPEFASVSDGDVSDLITVATSQMNANLFGDLYTIAAVYLAAHAKSVADRTSGVAGPLTSRRAGEVQESYGASVKSGASAYESTAYGQQFLQIRRSLVGRAPMLTAQDYVERQIRGV